jgi:DNA-binding transcriptional LysR family regulator
MFEVRRLRLLRELAARGTIAATAEACALTPSAVSQQLTLLEREARTTLLIRDGRRLVLTEAAHILVAHTERILAEMEQARAELASLSRSVRGTLRLVAFPSAASALAATAIAECQTANPDLHILLGEKEPERSLADLKAHRIDVALVYEYNLFPRIHDAGVELRQLVQEPLLLAMPTGHKYAHGSQPVTLDNLRHEHWIAPHSDSALRGVLERACQAVGFNPRLDYTSDDYSVITALVQAGLGVALIPRLAAEQVTAEVYLCPVADLDLTRTVSAAVRAGSAGDPAIAALLTSLHRAAGNG